MFSPTVERLRRYNRIASLIPNPDDSYLKWAYYVARNEDAYMEAYALVMRGRVIDRIPSANLQEHNVGGL